VPNFGIYAGGSDPLKRQRGFGEARQLAFEAIQTVLHAGGIRNAVGEQIERVLAGGAQILEPMLVMDGERFLRFTAKGRGASRQYG
jgi:hypothetical protein